MMAGLRQRAESLLRSPLAVVFLAGAIVFLALLDVYGLSLVPGKVDWNRFGTVGDWFQGIVNLGTVMVAAFAIRNDRRRAASDREQARKNLDDQLAHEARRDRDAMQKRAQAVFAWIEQTQDPVTRRPNEKLLVLANESGSPVYSWEVSDELADVVIVDSDREGPLLPGRSRIRVDWSAVLSGSPESKRLRLEFVGNLGERYSRVEGQVAKL